MQVRERCYRACLAHGRRWEEGEVRNVDKFDAKGDPILSTHFRLVEPGEEVDESDVHVPEKTRADVEAAAMRGDRETNIRKALEKLDPESNADWTSKGQPSLQRVFAITNLDNLQRGDIVEAWPAFDRELARELRKK